MEESMRLRRFCSFDANEVEGDIMQLKMDDNNQTLQVSIRVRRDEIKSENIPELTKLLIDSPVSLQNKLAICRLMKSLVKNKSVLNLQDFLFALKKINQRQIQVELCLMVYETYQHHKNSMTTDYDLASYIKELTETKCICSEALEILSKILQSHQIQNTLTSSRGNVDQLLFQNNRMYERQVQQTKSCQKHISSKEEEINLLSMIKGTIKFETEKQSANQNQNSTPLPPNNKENPGSDQRWFHKTYKFLLILYEKACNITNKNLLKSEDISKFLPQLFLMNLRTYKYLDFEIELIHHMIMDRMIAFIYYKISDQLKLDSKSLQKLIDCFTELNHEIFMERQNKPKQIKGLVVGKYENNNLIAQTFINQIKNFPTISMAENDISYFFQKNLLLSKQRTDIVQGLQVCLQKEFNKMRLDAIIAFKNQARLDKTIITRRLFSKLEQLLYDPTTDQALKKQVLDLITDYYESEITPNILDNLISTIDDSNDGHALQKLQQISKNQLDSLTLFDDMTIMEITQILCRSKNCDTILKLICVINNILLSHSKRALAHDVLNNLSLFLKNNKNLETRKHLLLLLLFSTENQSNQQYQQQHQISDQEYDQEFLNNLVEIYIGANEQEKNYVLLIFQNCRDNIIPISLFADKILSDQVILRDNDTIIFETNSSTIANVIAISTIACRIIYQCMKKLNGRQIDITSSLIQNLIKTQELCDPQTTIWSSKCLFSIARNMEIQMEQLLELEKYIGQGNDEVQIYLKLSYLEAILRRSKKNDSPLQQLLLGKSCSLYCVDQVSLELQNSGEILEAGKDINSLILKLLISESSKQKLPDQLFNLLNKELMEEEQKEYESEEKNEGEKKEILNQNKQFVLLIIKNQLRFLISHSIPAQLMSSFEYGIQNQFMKEQTFEMIEELIRSGNIISTFLAEEFINKLECEDKENRMKVFYTLDQISRNQELPEKLFVAIELERASISVEKSYEDELFALEYLQEKTSEGQELSIGILLRMANKLHLGKVFQILLNCQKNKQELPESLSVKVLEFFEPNCTDKLQLQIVTKIVKQLKSVPEQFLKKIKIALQNKDNYEQVLKIFAKLSNKILIEKEMVMEIGEAFIKTKNLELKHSLLKAVCNIINRGFYYALLSASLRHGLSIQNNKINTQIINSYLTYCNQYQKNREKTNSTLSNIISVNILENQCIESLLQKLFSCTAEVKILIQSILNLQVLNPVQKKMMEEATLIGTGKEQDLLDLFDSVLSENRVLNDCFEKIIIHLKAIQSPIHWKIISILSKHNNSFVQLPDSLVETLVNFIPKIKSKQLLKKLCSILTDIVSAGKIIKQEQIIWLSDLVVREDVLRLLQQIVKYQPNIPKQVSLILSICIINKDTEPKQILDTIYQVSESLLNSEMILPNFCIKKLMELNKKRKNEFINKNSYQQQFANILAKLYLEYSYNLKKIKCSSQITQIIEEAIMEQQLTDEILKCYFMISKRQKRLTVRFKIILIISKLLYLYQFTQVNSQRFEHKIKFGLFLYCLFYTRKQKILLALNNNEILQEDMSKSNNKKQKINIILCIQAASEYLKLPDQILDTFNSHLIDSQTMNIVLRTFPQECGLKEKRDIKHWCQQKLESISQQYNIKINDNPNLIEAVIFCQIGKLQIVGSSPQDQWPKQILINLIHQSFDLDDESRKLFHQHWFDFECERGPNCQSQALELLKNLNQCLFFNYSEINFNQLCEMIYLLKTVDLYLANAILLTEEKPYEQLKQLWVSTLLKKSFSRDLVQVQKRVKLSERILKNKNLSTEMIFAMLTQIKILTLKEFEDILLTFLETHKVRKFPTINETNNQDIESFVNSVEVDLLIGMFKSQLDFKQIENLLMSLLNKQWNFNLLKPLIQKALSRQQGIFQQVEQQLIDIIHMINNYSIPSECYEEMMKVFDSDINHWLKLTNIVIFQKSKQFSTNGRDMDTSLIKNSYIDSNKQNSSQLDQNLFLKDQILKHIKEQQGHTSIKFNSYILQKSTHKNLIEWNQKDILTWAQEVKKNSKIYMEKDPKKFIIEALIIANLAMTIAFSQNLKESQILACVTALNKTKVKGRLLEIGTGEGKSNIISVIAVINALQNYTVDIVTSNSDLAKRDAKRQRKFYELFELKCADNINKPSQLPKTKDCYSCEIVYGDANSFQFDHLTQASFKTFGNRTCQFLLIDEVDCYLIDERASIAKISFTPAGISLLNFIFSFIWHKVSHIFENLQEEGEEMKEEEREGVEVEETEEQFEQRIKNVIWSRFQEQKQYFVPEAYKGYVKQQFPTWVSNAIVAKKFIKSNVHFLIEAGKIIPIDNYNTGSLLEQTHWMGGLHQFLELDNSLILSNESYTTNFISMDAFLKKYQQNLIGFSATLGSEQIRKLIEEKDKIDSFIIPSQYHSQLVHPPDFLCQDEQEWIQTVCSLSITECRKERGVLIVCSSIKDVDTIHRALSRKYISQLIKCYKMNNRNEEIEIQRIRKGEIFIATNLGGRGTDIKIDEIQSIGGLHTILTYLPPIERVEFQIKGRSARQGKCGTFQLILIKDKHFNLSVRKELRDKQEILNLQEAYTNLPKQIEKDKHMDRYRLLIERMKESINIDYGKQYQIYLEAILNEIEFQWSFFLRQEDDLSNSNQESFGQFETKVTSNYRNKEFFKNNFNLIMIGNNITFANNKTEQHPYFETAINLDPLYSSAAYVGKGYIEIQIQQINCNKQLIREQLKKAIKILQDEIALNSNVYQALKINEKKDAARNSDLNQHNQQKQDLLLKYTESLRRNLRVIKLSSRLIDLKYDQLNKQYSFKNLEKNQILQKIASQSKANYSICFNHLTFVNDAFWSRDQYLNTLQSAHNGYQNLKISVVFKKQEFYKINELFFLKNVKYDSVNREKAIKLLKKKIDSDVNLIVYKDGTVFVEELKCKTSKSIQKIIEQNYSENVYSFTLEFPNKKYSEINKITNKKPLSLKFLKLNQNDASRTLDLLSAELDYIEISEKAKYLKRELYKFQGFDRENQIYYFNQQESYWQCLSIQAIIQHLNQVSEDSRHLVKLIEFNKANPKQIIKGISTENTAFFSLEFKNVKQNDLRISVSRDQLVTANIEINQQNAKKLIEFLREQKDLNFSLEFSELSNSQVQYIIHEADLKSEKLKIKNLSKLKDTFHEENEPIEQLEELRSRGIEYMFEVQEQNQLPWISLTILGVFALSQIAYGIYLNMKGQSDYGQAFIAEGIIDILIIARAVYTRQFSWKSYLLQKSTSLLNVLVEVGYAKVLSRYSKIQKLASSLNRSLSVVQRAIPQITSFIMELNMEKLEKKIKSTVKSQVQGQFDKCFNLRLILNKMHTLEKLKKITVTDEIKRFLKEITVNDIKGELFNFENGLKSSFFNSLEYISPYQRIVNLVNNIFKSTENIFQCLESRLYNEDKETYSMVTLLSTEEINRLSAQGIVQKLKDQKILVQYQSFTSENNFEYLNPYYINIRDHPFTTLNQQNLSITSENVDSNNNINYNEAVKVSLNDVNLGNENEKYKDKVINLCQQIIQNSSPSLPDTLISEIVFIITESLSQIIISLIKNFLENKGIVSADLLEQGSQQIVGFVKEKEIAKYIKVVLEGIPLFQYFKGENNIEQQIINVILNNQFTNRSLSRNQISYYISLIEVIFCILFLLILLFLSWLSPIIREKIDRKIENIIKNLKKLKTKEMITGLLLTMILLNILMVIKSLLIIIVILSITNKDKLLTEMIESKIRSKEDLKESEYYLNKWHLKHLKDYNHFFRMTKYLREEGNIIEILNKSKLQLIDIIIKTLSQLIDIINEYLDYQQKESLTHFQAIQRIIPAFLHQLFLSIYLKVYYFYDKRHKHMILKLSKQKNHKRLNYYNELEEKQRIEIKLSKDELEYISLFREHCLQIKSLVLLSVVDFLAESLQQFYQTAIKFYSIWLFQQFKNKAIPFIIALGTILLTVQLNLYLIVLFLITNHVSYFTKPL